MAHQMTCKVILLGVEGVGKTSIVLKYLKENCNLVNPTIGASFFHIKMRLENVDLTLEVWDTAGQERYRSMAPLYYRNVKAALLVYDITSYKSFQQLDEFSFELQKCNLKPVVMTMIGNKTDLIESRAVSKFEAKTRAEALGANYIETSVLENRGIEDAFVSMGLSLIHNFSPVCSTPDINDSVWLTEADRDEKTSRPFCCFL